jgi:hypothetical protein
MLTVLRYILIFVTLPIAAATAGPGDSTRIKRWYVPHYLPVQFAGNIGFLSTGVGYTSNNGNYQLSLLYGYAPRAIAGAEIHTIAAKNVFPLSHYAMKNNQTLIPYIGLGLIAEVGGNSFFRQPDHYPEGYYDFPKNLHVIAYGGAKVQRLFRDERGIFHGVEFFAEVGTVDIYLWYKAMSNQIKFHQVFSLALGVNLLLDHP